MVLRVGCCGFPVARSTYYGVLPTVEIASTFYNLPRPGTAARWAAEAPKGFEFSLKAWQLLTHPSSSPTYAKTRTRLDVRRLARCGLFRWTDETASAWASFSAVAEELAPRFILFQTPTSFYPNADHLRDMYRFFKGLRRGKAALAWEPRGAGWEDGLMGRICADLGLVPVVDPLERTSPTPTLRGPVNYFRLHGRREGPRRRVVYGHEFSDSELGDVSERCGAKPSYVYFNNAAMWRDARRFAELSCSRA